MARLTPYQWQIRDLQKLRQHNYTGLIAIEAGGSKTLEATLAIYNAKPDVTLIIAPKSTHETAWIPTVRDNAGITPRIMGNDNKATKAALADFLLGYPGCYLTTPQFVTRADVSDWSGDMLIIDEIHMGAVTPKSKLQRKISGYHFNDGEPLNRRFGMRLALSATPMRGDFANMWGVVRFLWPDLNQRGQVSYDNFVGWCMSRMTSKTVYTSQKNADGSPKTVKTFVTEAEPGRLMREMPCVIIHKRRETCCADPSHKGGFLPTEAPQVIERRVVLTPKQKKAIREMNDLMMTYLADNPLIAEISLTQKQRVRQLTLGEADSRVFMAEGKDGDPVEKTTIEFDPNCVSPVVDETLHILSNLPEKEPVVVYFESRKFADVMVQRLNKAGHKAAEYSGVTKADLTRFGKDYHILVGVISSIGTGTAGLNHVANTEIFAEQPISLTFLTQTAARLDRLDNTRRVQRYVILDDMGVQEGRMEDLWSQQIMVNQSLRVR